MRTPGVHSFDPPGNDADWADVGRHYIAYTGRFFLEETGDSLGPMLVHEMRDSNLPRLLGDRQRRLCEIKDENDGRYLYLSVKEPIKFNGEDRVPLVKWKRLAVNREIREPSDKRS